MSSLQVIDAAAVIRWSHAKRQLRFAALCPASARLLHGCVAICLPALFAACAAPPIYQLPADTADSAEVEVFLPPWQRNFNEGLVMRGEFRCNEKPGLNRSALVPKVVEGPQQTIARSMPGTIQHPTRLPAGQPLALRFWKTRVTEVRSWNFVVLLKPGGRYKASLDETTGPSIVDAETGAEALRLPPDFHQLLLQCP